MLYTVESDKPLETLAEDLEAAVTKHGFGVMTVHDLNETMARKGVRFERPCRIFEVCQPQRARDVLTSTLEISTALPCRISLYEEDGKAKLATIKPTAMLALFNRPELAGTAREVEDTIVAIMDEAAR